MAKITRQLLQDRAASQASQNTPLIDTQEATAVHPHPRQQEIDAINQARQAKGYNPIGDTSDTTIDAAIQHGRSNGYYGETEGQPNTHSSTMQGGITNRADKVVTTKESIDYDAPRMMLQAMQKDGLSYAQAFDKYYPKPTYNPASENNIKTGQKAALFADILRLIGEGTASHMGANVYKRDQQSPYNYFLSDLAKQQGIYAKRLSDWQAKGVDAAMKDMQERKAVYEKAPRIKTTTETNNWDREKFQKELNEHEKQRDFDAAQKKKDRNTKIAVAAMGGDGSKKETNIILNDKTELGPTRTTFSIPNKDLKSVVGNMYNDMRSQYRGIINKNNSERTPDEQRIAEDISFLEEVYKSGSNADAEAAINSRINSYPNIARRHLSPYMSKVQEDVGYSRPKSIYDTGEQQKGKSSKVKSIYD